MPTLESAAGMPRVRITPIRPAIAIATPIGIRRNMRRRKINMPIAAISFRFIVSGLLPECKGTV
ncbi:hypothetical protein ES703_78432 [subsurface metagenome]